VKQGPEKEERRENGQKELTQESGDGVEFFRGVNGELGMFPE